MDEDMRQYREVFLSEAAEYVQAITDGLLALESDPDDLEPVEVIFRGAHSLKSMAAMMDYQRTAELTHKMESVIDKVRAREQLVDSSLIDLMLRAIDAVRILIDDESSGRLPAETRGLLDALTRRAAGGAEAAPETGSDREGEQWPESQDDIEGVARRVVITLDEDSVLKSVRAYMAIKRLNRLGNVIDTQPSLGEIEDERFGDSFEVTLRTTEGSEEIVASLLSISEVVDVKVLGAAASAEGPRSGAVSNPDWRRTIPKLTETQTVRVSIGHLDKLVNLVGELVILRSRLESIASTLPGDELAESLEELHRVSAELQHEVMQTRMVPVGNIFNRFPRMVRDLARDLGKQIAFEMDGLDIELDRTVLDEIGDPIVHLLRNSIDHGLESPEARVGAGKRARGVLQLRAARERDQVRIIVADDGRGIDPGSIWAKACKIGIVDPSARDLYSTRDILLLTCVPGFSTAEQTTKISGRGVGMDVVKDKIENLGGTLFINSRVGAGTEFVLTLPLTLAIIQALMLGSEGQVYALPLSSVSEVLSPDEVPVQSIDGSPVVVLRDDSVVPLLHLDAVLGIGEGSMDPGRGKIVLMEAGLERRALFVPAILGRQEIVVKPLTKMFPHIQGLGGATVLGDGRIALILDPRSVFESTDDEESS